MRIIAGTHRGRPLLGPEGEGATSVTRPITDRVKETLFNRLTSLGLFDPDDPGRVVDAYAGTGSLGLESLSRGASHCLFLERDRSALRVLEENVRDLGLADRSRILARDAASPGWIMGLEEGSVRLVFLDPPYASVEDAAGLARVSALLEPLLPKLEPGGVVVLRTPKEIEAGEVAGYDGPVRAVYGTMAVHFFGRPLEDSMETEE